MHSHFELIITVYVLKTGAHVHTLTYYSKFTDKPSANLLTLAITKRTLYIALDLSSKTSLLWKEFNTNTISMTDYKTRFIKLNLLPLILMISVTSYSLSNRSKIHHTILISGHLWVSVIILLDHFPVTNFNMFIHHRIKKEIFTLTVHLTTYLQLT